MTNPDPRVTTHLLSLTIGLWLALSFGCASKKSPNERLCEAALASSVFSASSKAGEEVRTSFEEALSQGANPNASCDKYGHTPLLQALFWPYNLAETSSTGGFVPHLEPVRSAINHLLKAGANPNAFDPLKGTTPLMQTAAIGDEDIIRTLLEAGANPCDKSRDGKHQVASFYAFHAKHDGTGDMLRGKETKLCA